MKVFPLGVSDANACISAFFAGHTAMMVLSTGSLSFVRDNMKMPYRLALMPRKLRNAAPIRGLADPAEGQYPGAPKTPRALIGWLRSREIAGEWSRFTGYFAPHKAAYDLPEMKDICNSTPTRRSPRPAAIRRPLVRNLQPRSRAQGDRGPGPGNPLRQQNPGRCRPDRS